MASPALRQEIEKGGFITAPGVFELISALIADRMGFKALYVTGYGTVASALGLPDAGLASYSQMIDRIGRIAAMTKTPIIADADTGYGGLLNVRHTVRGYEKAGVTAIQIEDQEFPKKCGHTPDRRVIPVADMVRKIRVASRQPLERGLSHHRAHRRADGHRLGRGDPAWHCLCRGGGGHHLHRIAGNRRGIGRVRAPNRQAAARQHGQRRPHADAAGRSAQGHWAFRSRSIPAVGFLRPVRRCAGPTADLQQNGTTTASRADVSRSRNSTS